MKILTERQKEVAKQFEALLHRRFNEDSLNKELSRIFGEEVKVSEWTEDDPCWNGDWCYTFEISSGELEGYFDLYFLKMREQNEEYDDGLRFYITEIDYNFEYHEKRI